MKLHSIMSVQGYLQALIIRISEPTAALHARDPVRHTPVHRSVMRGAQRPRKVITSPVSVLLFDKAATIRAEEKVEGVAIGTTFNGGGNINLDLRLRRSPGSARSSFW
jgi:hypothetical protein